MSDRAAPRSWRSSPWTRLLGAAGSWFLFALCFALLFQAASAVIGLGGYCASGGPYVIETECPEAVVLFMPLSIFGGFAAVGLSLAFAQGFGTPLLTLAWPILFCGLAITFFIGFAAAPAVWTWLLCGVLFVAMGLAPLVLGLRTDARAVVIGTFSIEGRPFAESGSGRSWVPMRVVRTEERVIPGLRDWMLALGTTLVAGGLGTWLAVAWFRALGG